MTLHNDRYNHTHSHTCLVAGQPSSIPQAADCDDSVPAVEPAAAAAADLDEDGDETGMQARLDAVRS